MGTPKNDYRADMVRNVATTPPDASELPDDHAAGELNGQSRGSTRRPSTRRGRPTKAKRPGRNLKLSDPVFMRLQLEALKKKWSVSDVAEFILDGALPRHKIADEAS